MVEVNCETDFVAKRPEFQVEPATAPAAPAVTTGATATAPPPATTAAAGAASASGWRCFAAESCWARSPWAPPWAPLCPAPSLPPLPHCELHPAPGARKVAGHVIN